MSFEVDYKPGDKVRLLPHKNGGGFKATALLCAPTERKGEWIVKRINSAESERLRFWKEQDFELVESPESLQEGDEIKKGDTVSLEGIQPVTAIGTVEWVWKQTGVAQVFFPGGADGYSEADASIPVALAKLTKVKPVVEEEKPKTLEQQFRTIISDGIREFQENGGVVGTLADSGMYVRDNFVNALSAQLAELASAIPVEDRETVKLTKDDVRVLLNRANRASYPAAELIGDLRSLGVPIEISDDVSLPTEEQVEEETVHLWGPDGKSYCRAFITYATYAPDIATCEECKEQRERFIAWRNAEYEQFGTWRDAESSKEEPKPINIIGPITIDDSVRLDDPEFSHPEKTLREKVLIDHPDFSLYGQLYAELGRNSEGAEAALRVFREHFNAKRKEIEYAFECYRNGYNTADPERETEFIETLLFGDEQ